MAKCTYFGSCPIPNKKLPTTPELVDIMRDNFCTDRFTKCAVYKAAIDGGVGEASNGGCNNVMKWFSGGK